MVHSLIFTLLQELDTQASVDWLRLRDLSTRSKIKWDSKMEPKVAFGPSLGMGNGR